MKKRGKNRKEYRFSNSLVVLGEKKHRRGVALKKTTLPCVYL